MNRIKFIWSTAVIPMMLFTILFAGFIITNRILFLKFYSGLDLFSIITITVGLILLWKSWKENLITPQKARVLLFIFLFNIPTYLGYSFILEQIKLYGEITIDEIGSCEQGNKVAQEDISNGHLSLILGGLGIDEKFATTLENNYNIRVYRRGCIWTTGWHCYNETMSREIKKRFGDEVLEIEQ